MINGKKLLRPSNWFRYIKRYKEVRKLTAEQSKDYTRDVY